MICFASSRVGPFVSEFWISIDSKEREISFCGERVDLTGRSDTLDDAVRVCFCGHLVELLGDVTRTMFFPKFIGECDECITITFYPALRELFI